MAKSTRHAGQPWTGRATSALRALAAGNTPTRVIGLKLGRSASAIYSKASQLGISLKPTNRSPYKRRDRHGQ